jgi:hypothetical protein
LTKVGQLNANFSFIYMEILCLGCASTKGTFLFFLFYFFFVDNIATERIYGSIDTRQKDNLFFSFMTESRGYFSFTGFYLHLNNHFFFLFYLQTLQYRHNMKNHIMFKH